jgi:hypothetical protein
MTPDNQKPSLTEHYAVVGQWDNHPRPIAFDISSIRNGILGRHFHSFVCHSLSYSGFVISWQWSHGQGWLFIRRGIFLPESEKFELRWNGMAFDFVFEEMDSAHWSISLEGFSTRRKLSHEHLVFYPQSLFTLPITLSFIKTSSTSEFLETCKSEEFSSLVTFRSDRWPRLIVERKEFGYFRSQTVHLVIFGPMQTQNVH